MPMQQQTSIYLPLNPLLANSNISENYAHVTFRKCLTIDAALSDSRIAEENELKIYLE